MDIPTNQKYTENDEWIRVEGEIGIIGITDYAQEQLSDIVFLEVIVSEGEEVAQGDSCATVESVKAAADVYMPVSGKIIEVNDELPDTPEVINSDPYGEAWLLKVEIGDPAEVDALLDAAAYQAIIDEKEA
jgi:glycine cleavage system H protein